MFVRFNFIETATSFIDISKAMYPDVKDYNILLVIEEAGAQVKYLYQHGHLTIANLQEVETEDNPTILYDLID